MNEKVIHICKQCNKKFKGHPSNINKYCSYLCYYKSKLTGKYNICKNCNKRYYVSKNNGPKYKQKGYCSPICYQDAGFFYFGNFKKGHQVPQEWRDKFKKLLKGKRTSINTEFKKGNLPPKHKEDCQCFRCRPDLNTRYKIKKGQYAMKKHYNWQGGKSFEPYGIKFNNELKEKIRKRDNYTCQECNIHQKNLFTKTNKNYKLLIHHIDYNKKNNNKDNLISLCRSCHCKTNFKREDWTKYFYEKQKSNLG